jgi:hypothetical protein
MDMNGVDILSRLLFFSLPYDLSSLHPLELSSILFFASFLRFFFFWDCKLSAGRLLPSHPLIPDTASKSTFHLYHFYNICFVQISTMMAKLRESLAGPGYLILNAVRVINIIVFLDMIAACAVMLVKINMLNGFFFFQAVTHAVVALISSE